MVVMQGNTLENVAMELERIIATGYYTFQLDVCKGTDHSGGDQWQLFLEYEPYTATFSTSNTFSSTITSTFSNDDTHVVAIPQHEGELSLNGNFQHCKERKTSEQINDFVRKLGFMDKEKEGGDFIKDFLYFSQVSLKCSLSFSYFHFPFIFTQPFFLHDILFFIFTFS